MTLKAVIFDFGDVLVRCVDERRRTAWAQRVGLTPETMEFIVFGGETGWAVQLGRVSDDEHWRWVQRRLGLEDEALLRFRADFFADDQLDAGLLAYVRRLRGRYHLGLLSNAMRDARQAFAARYDILRHFDSVTISAEEGVMKPDPAIYRIALARAGVKPEEALFIDDSLRNVEGARGVGMAALHYADPPTARRRLVELTGVEDGDE